MTCSSGALRSSGDQASNSRTSKPRAARSGAIAWGYAWEWTATPFAPYPGFVPGRYAEYSAPWFYTHQVVRGASHVTRPRLRNPGYRNFYLPERADVFIGFRTCAIDSR